MDYHGHIPRVELTTEEIEALIHLRGGCTCFIFPPCSACSTPIHWDECEDLGIDPLRDAPKSPIDYMKAVRDLCKGD